MDAWLENPKRPTDRKPSLMDEVIIVTIALIIMIADNRDANSIDYHYNDSSFLKYRSGWFLEA